MQRLNPNMTMESDAGAKKDAPRLRRRRVSGTSGNGAPVEPTPPPRDHLYFQVHFQPRPGARKNHFAAIRPRLTERLHEMVRRGQLLFSGGYPTSIGGMWLLKVKTHTEAERLVLDNPAVACNLVTYRLVELSEPLGLVVQQDRAPSLEPLTP